MTSANPLDDPIGFIKRTMDEIGAPIDAIAVKQNVAIQKGGNLPGIAYYVGGKGQYNTEREARESMGEGDRLYRIDVQRLD